MKDSGKLDFIDQLVSDLLSLGVSPGGVLMVHPALRPFGWLPGGPKTIIKGLLTALGGNGTLLMPALSWENVNQENPVFDVRRTPSCVGTIAESFRLFPGLQRSLHPTHSVCGIGPLADELITPHCKDFTPCGPNSPFHRLRAFKGQILMLACSLEYNTSMHAIEELVEPPYLYAPQTTYTLIDKSGQVHQKDYIPHNFIGWQQHYDRVSDLLKTPDLRSSLVAGTQSYLIKSHALWETALGALQKNPLHFINRLA